MEELVELDPEAMERERTFWKEIQERADEMLAGCAIPKKIWDQMLQESPNRRAALSEVEQFRRRLQWGR